jgi:hypothetical protein
VIAIERVMLEINRMKDVWILIWVPDVVYQFWNWFTYSKK